MTTASKSKPSAAQQDWVLTQSVQQVARIEWVLNKIYNSFIYMSQKQIYQLLAADRSYIQEKKLH